MQQYASWCIEDGHQQKLRSLATDYPSMVQVFNTNIQIHALCSYVYSMSTGPCIFRMRPPFNECGYGPA